MTDVYNNLNTFFNEGGFFLYPIAIVFAFGIAIAIERWLFLTREKMRNIKAFNEFLPLLRSTDVDNMHQYSRENTAPVTRIIACGLDMMKVSKQRADVENAMSEGMLETMPKLEKRTGYLSVLANVATLLGLLGTIIGLIGAFTAVSDADPAQKSQLLSSSISVAMNTTAFGLIAAIPLLILHAVLQNKASAIVSSIEMSAVKFLNLMTLNRFIEAGIARSAYESVSTQIPLATAPQAAPAPQATAPQATVPQAAATQPTPQPAQAAVAPPASTQAQETAVETALESTAVTNPEAIGTSPEAKGQTNSETAAEAPQQSTEPKLAN